MRDSEREDRTISLRDQRECRLLLATHAHCRRDQEKIRRVAEKERERDQLESRVGTKRAHSNVGPVECVDEYGDARNEEGEKSYPTEVGKSPRRSH